MNFRIRKFPSMRFRCLFRRRLTRFLSTSQIAKKNSLHKMVNNEYRLSPRIEQQLGKNLHKNPSMPIGIIKEKIEHFFAQNFVCQDSKESISPSKRLLFKTLDSLDPIVSTTKNFDDLLIPKDHPSRSVNETYYVDKDKVLRTHTTCHEVELLKKGYDAFIVTGDCYRKDTIDATHFPVFHQTEGARLFDKESVSLDYVVADLKSTLTSLINYLFGQVEFRWKKDYFPFTDPSFELEVKYNGKWLELLGCGILQKEVLDRANRKDKIGWAFGIGLERLAMALFGIHDIRLFHSEDERFKKQFRSGEITKFRPFSKFPACYKDVSFWIEDGFSETEFFSIVREVAGDLIESIQLVDSFVEDKSNNSSRCYRLTYRSFSRSLTNEEVDKVQGAILEQLGKVGSITLR